jgi:hypothetical protein
MNPSFTDPDPAWTYEQQTLVNPTVAGHTVFVGGADLTALDLRDGTERWSSDAITGRIVTAPTVAVNPARGHSIDERIRHQTLNRHDALEQRPASFRVGGGRLSAAELGIADEYWFPDDQTTPRRPLDGDARYVGRINPDGRIVVPRTALTEFQAEHGTAPGCIVEIHNTGGVTTEKPVAVRVGETTLETTIPVQGYGVGLLYLFADLAATPGYARAGIEADTTKTYFDGAALINFSGDQLLSGSQTDLTVSTPDHERTIRFGAPGETASPTATDSSPTEPEPVDGDDRGTTATAGPGFGVLSGAASIAAGGFARHVWRNRDDTE